MDTRTGQIRNFEKLTDAQKKIFVPILAEDADRVQGMNRAQRRAWAKERGLVMPKAGERNQALAAQQEMKP